MPVRTSDSRRGDERLKKSTSGIKTPKREVDLIEQRLRLAETDYQRLRKEQRDESTARDKESK